MASITLTAEQLSALIASAVASAMTSVTAVAATTATVVSTQGGPPAEAKTTKSVEKPGLFYIGWANATKKHEAGTDTNIFKIAKAAYSLADENLCVKVEDLVGATGLALGQIQAKVYNWMCKDMSHCDGIYFESFDRKAGTCTWRPESFDTVKKYFEQ